MVKQLAEWSKQYYGTLLLVILAISFFSRVWNLSNPEGYIFDEVYHGVTSKLISRNDPRAYEWWNAPVEPNTAVDWLHPPLAKYTQALGIRFFGENAFGWRFSSVIFGTLVVFMTAQLAKTVSGDEQTALLAALLAASDGLLLVQSRIAMNDIHVTFMILLVLTWYAKSHPTLHKTDSVTQSKQVSTKALVSVGVLAGLAMATKWSGLFALITVIVFEVLGLGKGIEWKKTGYWLQWILTRVLCLAIIPLTMYLLSYSHMFMQGKDLQHFFDMHKQIYWYQTNLKAEHPYQSRPWQWVTNMRPAWYHVQYADGKRGDIYAFGNPMLFWAGAAAVVISSLALLKQVTKKLQKKQITASRLVRAIRDSAIQPMGLMIASYFAVWLPWQLSPRIMFFYHYAPAVPLMAIILSWVLLKHPELRKLSVALVLLILITFAVWYPHWTGIPVSTEFKDTVYFATERWK